MEKILKRATVCFLLRDNQVLLALKPKRSEGERKIGENCRNGYGGGIEAGETEKQGVVREVKEEGNISLEERDLEKVAIVDFHNATTEGKTFVCRVHFFIARKWSGEPGDTAEMIDPRWFEIDALPFDSMMPADRQIIPPMLQGKKFITKVHYTPRQESLIGDIVINEVDRLPEEE